MPKTVARVCVSLHSMQPSTRPPRKDPGNPWASTEEPSTPAVKPPAPTGKPPAQSSTRPGQPVPPWKQEAKRKEDMKLPPNWDRTGTHTMAVAPKTPPRAASSSGTTPPTQGVASSSSSTMPTVQRVTTVDTSTGSPVTTIGYPGPFKPLHEMTPLERQKVTEATERIRSIHNDPQFQRPTVPVPAPQSVPQLQPASMPTMPMVTQIQIKGQPVLYYNSIHEQSTNVRDSGTFS